MSQSSAQPTVEQAQGVMSAYMEDLKTIVNIDSGTFTKAGVDQVGEYLAGRFKDFGFATTFDHQHTYGNNLVATHTGSAPSGPRILLIGHIDTVFAAGEAEKRPFAIGQRDGKRVATGPGVLDMKSGVLIGLYGVHLLIQQSDTPYQQLTFICNSDEEIGSPGSKPLIQELARQSDAVIVLEPGRKLANVVSSRRSSGQYRVQVHGLSAHAGVEPQNGRNAIHELSYKVQAMQALNGTVPGTTLSVGVIRGGERTNVVPDYAYFDMDVRSESMQGIQDIESAMRQVASHTTIEGTTTTFSGDMRCLPFERSEQNAGLVEKAKAAGKELGLDIQEMSTGGASDANTTSGMGIPTIDGLGAAGGLAHNPDEYIELDSLPTRIAFFSGLVRHIGA